MVAGDFSQFVIVDRIGATIEMVPLLMGATNRFPTGQRGAYFYARVGSGVLKPGAFEYLEVCEMAPRKLLVAVTSFACETKDGEVQVSSGQVVAANHPAVMGREACSSRHGSDRRRGMTTGRRPWTIES